MTRRWTLPTPRHHLQETETSHRHQPSGHWDECPTTPLPAPDAEVFSWRRRLLFLKSHSVLPICFTTVFQRRTRATESCCRHLLKVIGRAPSDLPSVEGRQGESVWRTWWQECPVELPSSRRFLHAGRTNWGCPPLFVATFECHCVRMNCDHMRAWTVIRRSCVAVVGVLCWFLILCCLVLTFVSL